MYAPAIRHSTNTLLYQLREIDLLFAEDEKQ